MNFKTPFFIALAALALGACGDDDDAPATQTDLLVANNWQYDDFYVLGQPLGLPSCQGDDFLEFKADGTVAFNTATESDTCTFNFIEYSGTYEVRNDSLFIDALDTDGDQAGGDFEITLLNGAELRIQGEDTFLGTAESRYTAQ